MRKLKAYQEKGGNLANLPPPTRGNYDHYVQCKYCGRKFAPQVGQKHIPKCANIINKPGGIKTSKIQEKYIGGSGVGGGSKIVGKTTSTMNQQQVQPSPVKLASKPQMISKNVRR